MFKLNFDCQLVAEDQDTGYWGSRAVTGRDIYSFMVALCSALSEINIEAGNYHKIKEIEEMENGELPF